MSILSWVCYTCTGIFVSICSVNIIISVADFCVFQICDITNGAAVYDVS